MELVKSVNARWQERAIDKQASKQAKEGNDSRRPQRSKNSCSIYNKTAAVAAAVPFQDILVNVQAIQLTAHNRLATSIDLIFFRFSQKR